MEFLKYDISIKTVGLSVQLNLQFKPYPLLLNVQ